jgi:hypothetical protein
VRTGPLSALRDLTKVSSVGLAGEGGDGCVPDAPAGPPSEPTATMKTRTPAIEPWKARFVGQRGTGDVDLADASRPVGQQDGFAHAMSSFGVTLADVTIREGSETFRARAGLSDKAWHGGPSEAWGGPARRTRLREGSPGNRGISLMHSLDTFSTSKAFI